MSIANDPWSNFFTSDFSAPMGRFTQRPAPEPAPTRVPKPKVATPLDDLATSPTRPTPTPAPAPSAPEPAPAPASTAQSTWDRQREGVKMQYEAELAGAKQRQAAGQPVNVIEMKRIGERYQNAIRGIDAAERMANRKNNRPTQAKKPTTPAPAAASTSASSAAATAAPQSTQTATTVKNIFSKIPAGMLDKIAEPTPAPAPAAAPAPAPALAPVPVGGEPPSSADILGSLSPEVKRRLAELNRAPSAFADRLRSMPTDARNTMIRTIATLPPNQQLSYLSDLENQIDSRIMSNFDRTPITDMNQRVESSIAQQPPEYRAEWEALKAEYERQGVDFANMGDRGMDGFLQDLQRRLARKYPDRYGTAVSPGSSSPQTLAEHLGAAARDLDARTPGLRLGTQFESAANLGAMVGPLAPVVGGTVLGAGAAASAATSSTLDDDAALAALSMIGTKGRARYTPDLVPETPPSQLPPQLPPAGPGPLPPNRQIGRTLITPEPGPLPPNRQLPASRGGLTDDALTELSAPPPAAPASKQGLADRARVSDPAVAARDAAATPSPGTGIPVRAPDEQGLLPGFRRSTADFRRFMGDRVDAMRGRPAVSTPDMAPGAPRDVPGQRMLPFDRAEKARARREAKAAEAAAQSETNLRSRVSEILESFASGGG